MGRSTEAATVRVKGAMRCYLHILTDCERIVDPDGQVFPDLTAAVAEANQCARLLMAEELRRGRPLPLKWRVQVADASGSIRATAKFSEILFGEPPTANTPPHHLL